MALLIRQPLLTVIAGGPSLLTESAATSDSFSGAATLPNALTESVATSDSFVGAATLPNTRTETAATSDSFTGVATLPNALSESAATSDSFTATATFPNTLTETALTSDVFSTAQLLTESASTSDTYTVSGIFGVTLTETAATSDIFASTVTSSVTLSESATTGDSLTSIGTFSVTLAESAATGDSFAGAKSTAATLTESAATGDTYTGNISVITTVYYFSAAGADANDGLSPATSKKTITAANALPLNIGDTILFNGGDTFAISGADQTFSFAKNGVKISSYGTGQGIIDNTANPASAAIYSEGSDVWIDNIKVQGPGIATSSARGISTWAYTGDAGGSNRWKVTRCTVDGFYWGIDVGCDPGNPISGVVVGGAQGQGNVISNCGYGVEIEPDNSSAPTLISNATISWNIIHDMKFEAIDAGANFKTIIDTVLIEHNVCWNIALTHSAIGTGGPSGIIFWGGSNPTIRLNEVYNVGSTSLGVDGNGIAMESTDNGLCENNYIHDTGGPGVEMLDSTIGNSTNCTTRYNLLVNCCREATSNYGMINQGRIGGALAINPRIYQNTIVVTAASARAVFGFVGGGSPPGGVIANNLIYGNGTTPMVTGSGGIAFVDHNLEFGVAGTYGTNVVASDPMFFDASTIPVMGPAGFDSTVVNGYRVRDGSPAINAGLDLTTLGITLPQTDFWGNRITTQPTNIGAYDAGIGGDIDTGEDLWEAYRRRVKRDEERKREQDQEPSGEFDEQPAPSAPRGPVPAELIEAMSPPAPIDLAGIEDLSDDDIDDLRDILGLL